MMSAMPVRLLRKCSIVLTLGALGALTVLSALPAQAASLTPASAEGGTVVTLRAAANVLLDNDVATVTLTIQEQQTDKAEAISKVNERTRRALALLHQADPDATLKTLWYSTYAVYPPQTERPRAASAALPALPSPQGWHVSQSIRMTTSHLAALAKTAGAVQGTADLNGIDFSISEKTRRQADDQRIAQSWQALNARIESVARAMGKPAAAAKLLEVNLDGAEPARPALGMMKSGAPMMRAMSSDAVENSHSEPSFEPGQTEMSMDIAATVQFPQ